MKKLLLIPVALVAAAFIACGGGNKTADTEVAEVPTATSTTAPGAPGETAAPEPTVILGYVLDEAWATEQVIPVIKTMLEAMLDQRWNDLYDMLPAESKALCSRTEYVENLMGVWLITEMFGADELFEATLLELEDGTYQPTFSEISAERLSFIEEGEDEVAITLVFEDGQWRLIDDGTCMEMDNWEEGG